MASQLKPEVEELIADRATIVAAIERARARYERGAPFERVSARNEEALLLSQLRGVERDLAREGVRL